MTRQARKWNKRMCKNIVHTPQQKRNVGYLLPFLFLNRTLNSEYVMKYFILVPSSQVSLFIGRENSNLPRPLFLFIKQSRKMSCVLTSVLAEENSFACIKTAIKRNQSIRQYGGDAPIPFCAGCFPPFAVFT